jgi:pimeloyl-ACP methyl ester carboxylesterase
MRTIRIWISLGFLVISTTAISAAEFRSVTLGDGTRIDFAVVLPPDFDADRTYPLLLALPPGRQDERMVRAGLSSYWEEAARQLGFIFASPIAPEVMFFRGVERHVPAFLDEIGRILPIDGAVHLAGISNGGLSAFRIAGLYPPLFQSITVLPGFPPTGEDRENLSKLKHMRITMFVGETDQPWRERSEETAQALRDLGVEVQLAVIPGEGHFLRSLAGAGIAPLITALKAARFTE